MENENTFGKENLNIKHFINMECWVKGQKEKLKEYYDVLEEFYNYIKGARNKIIGHNDLSIYNKEKANGLGAFPEGLDDKFVETLEKFYNYLHEITFGEIWGGFCPNVEAGGIYELISFLYQGLAFETIVNDQKTSSKIKMLLVEKELEIKKF